MYPLDWRKSRSKRRSLLDIRLISFFIRLESVSWAEMSFKVVNFGFVFLSLAPCQVVNALQKSRRVVGISGLRDNNDALELVADVSPLSSLLYSAREP